MIQEILQMPVADIKPFTANEWAELWRKEADARIQLWKEHQEVKSAIKAAYWQLLPFLKPGDEKTKAVLEELQRFM